MNMIWFLLPLAMALSGLFLFFFLSSVFRGDYDDLNRSERLPFETEDNSQPPVDD